MDTGAYAWRATREATQGSYPCSGFEWGPARGGNDGDGDEQCAGAGALARFQIFDRGRHTGQVHLVDYWSGAGRGGDVGGLASKTAVLLRICLETGFWKDSYARSSGLAMRIPIPSPGIRLGLPSFARDAVSVSATYCQGTVRSRVFQQVLRENSNRILP